MGCKVEKVVIKGEDSKLYKDLRESMSEPVALKAYLDITSKEDKYKEIYGENSQNQVDGKSILAKPKYRLKEFHSVQEEADVMDYMAKKVIANIKTIAGLESKMTIAGLDISKIATDKSILIEAITKTKDDIANDVIDSEGGRDLDLLLLAAGNIDTYLMDGGKLGVLGRALQDYGLPIQAKDKGEVEVIYDDMQEQNGGIDEEMLAIQYERIYDLDMLEQSPIRSVLDSVRLYIKGKGKVHSDYKYQTGKPIEYEVSAVGADRPSNHLEVTAKLFTVLAGVQSQDEMIDRISVAVVHSPELAPILSDLENEVPIETKVSGKAIKYKPIATALFSAFAKQNYDMFTIVEHTDGRVSFESSNASSVQKNLLKQWAETAEDLKGMSEAARKKKIAALKRLVPKGRTQRLINSLNKQQLRAINGQFEKIFGTDYTDFVTISKHLDTKPSKFTKGNKTEQLSSIVQGMIENVLIPIYEGKDIFSYGENREGRYLNLMAETVSKRKNDVVLGAFLSGRGSMVHPINQASEAQDMLQRLKINKDGIREQMMRDPLYANSLLLTKAMSDEHIGMFVVETLDVINDNSQRGKGVKYGGMSEYDASVSRLNSYLGSSSKGYFKAFSPTQADRGNLQTLTVPKLNTDKTGLDKAVFNSDGSVAEGEILDWLDSHVDAEITRIKAFNSKKKGIVKYANFHGKDGNGGKFSLFEELNQLEGKQRTNKKTVMRLLTGPHGVFRTVVNSDIDFMIKNDILERNGTGYKYTKSARESLGSTNAKKRVTRASIENFIANNFIYTKEQTDIYVGDMSYFKMNTDKAPNAQKIDLNKRFGLPFTPGTKLSVGENTSMPATSNVMILNEAEVTSEYKDLYQDIIGDKSGKSYKNTEIADGVGFVSLERYAQIMMSQGMGTDEAIAMINNLNNMKNAAEAKSYIEVLKTFYFRNQMGKNGTFVPFNMKYSIVPAIPAFFEAKNSDGDYKYEGMAEISKRLRAKPSKGVVSVDEIVMSSAVKVGISEATNLGDLFTAGHTTIHNESYRIPQPSPSKEKVEDMFGSQMRKIITGNVVSGHKINVGKNVATEEQALGGYENALTQLTTRKGNEVYNKFINDKGEVKLDQLVNQVLSDIESNNYNNIEYYQEALEVMDDTGDTRLPISYPTLRYKLDTLINSAYKNKVNRLKLPGHSAVQIPSMGMSASFQNGGLKVASDLKFVRITDMKGNELKGSRLKKAQNEIKAGTDVSEKYKIEPAEIRVTPKFFLNNIKKIARKNINMDPINEEMEIMESMYEEGGPFEGTDAHVAKRELENMRAQLIQQAVNERFEYLVKSIKKHDGTYDIKKIKDTGLDEVVLYRIPTQAKNSMLPARIKEFLPREMGGTIQVPGEIVDQSGSDFDIDKVYIEMSDFNMNGRNFKKIDYPDLGTPEFETMTDRQAKAYIVDYHKAVLRSPQHVQELLSTNNTTRLGDIATEFGLNDSVIGNWATMSTQEKFRGDNQAGKDLISITSVASAAHSIADKIGIQYDQEVRVAGIPLRFGERNAILLADETKNVLISQDLEQLQNASMDNAKDPLLGKLNITQYTANAVTVAVSAGLGLKYAVAMVNSEIVKDLSTTYPKYARKNTAFMAVELAIEEVTARHKIKLGKDTLDNAVTLATKSREDVIAHRNNTDQASKIEHLANFLVLKDLGDQLSNTQRALNFDSKGTPSSVPALINRYIALSNIKGTMTYNREQNGVEITTDPGYKQKAAPNNKKKALNTLREASRRVRRTADEKHYQNLKTGQKMERLSTALGLGMSAEDAQKQHVIASTIAGTTIDNAVRDFFTGARKEGSPIPGMTKEAVAGLDAGLARIKKILESRKETPITDNESLIVSDPKLNVAGEMDMITFKEDGTPHIYDVKTMKKYVASEYQDKKDGEKWIAERNTKHHKQLNGYRALLRNSTDMVSDELTIIPFKIDYNKDGTEITSVELKDFIEHKVDETILYDTRGATTKAKEKIAQVLGKERTISPMKVDSYKYKAHSLSSFETNSIIKPLETQRKVTVSASVVAQNIVNQAQTKIGYMTENQQTALLAEFDTFLAQNKEVNSNQSSGLSSIMSDMYDLTSDGPGSTASIIKSYREAVKEAGVPENKFIEAMKVTTQKGRKFVTFNNTISKAISGDGKRQLMYAFEDLMNGTQFEKQLAKSLANYAVSHYGFKTGVNSFMELIPPSAHEMFMGAENGIKLPELFRNVRKDYENIKNFPGAADKYIDMYVQNNAMSLNLPRITKSNKVTLHDLTKRRTVPTYALVHIKDSDYQLKRYNKETNIYEDMDQRGIRNFAVDYAVEPLYITKPVDEQSIYADFDKSELYEDYSQKDGKEIGRANKKASSKIQNSNPATMWQSYMAQFQGDLRKTTNEAEARKVLKPLFDGFKKLAKTSDISQEALDSLENEFDAAVENTMFNRKKRKGILKKGETYASFLDRKIVELVTDFNEGIINFESSQEIIEKIKNC